MRVRSLAELAVRDTVLLPSGKLATVTGFDEGAVLLETYHGEELQLLPHLLELVSRAPKHQFPPRFFDAVPAGRVP